MAEQGLKSVFEFVSRRGVIVKVRPHAGETSTVYVKSWVFACSLPNFAARSVQSQVGFHSKKDSSARAPLHLPTVAFEKLSGMESLAGVLAGLAQKFDTTAFLWLLLQR